MIGRAMGKHVATIAAYEMKVGGFRGVYKAKGEPRVPSETLFQTLAEARFWAQTQAFNRHGHEPGYTVASVRRRGEYLANIWIH